jgi:hypothetical protein
MDHVVLTRQYIISKVNNLPSLENDKEGLMSNQVFIGTYLFPKRNGQIVTLLQEHISIADKIVAAAMISGDTKQLIADWHTNAVAIAEELHRLNPRFKVDETRDMLFNHLSLTLDEAVKYIQKDYNESLFTFYKVQTQALQMGDMFARKIHLLSFLF